MAVILSDGIGSVILGADAPEHIPLGGELTGEGVRLGDGTRLYALVGWTPHDITLEGVMHARDGAGDPLSRLAALEAMAQRHQPVQFTWQGDRAKLVFDVLITSFSATLQGHNDVAYSLTLFRGVRSALVSGGAASAQAAASAQGSTNVGRLRQAAPQAGPHSTAATNVVLAAHGLLRR